MVILGLMMVLVSASFIAAVAQPFASPLIVVFGNSEAERVTVSILSHELPSSAVVEYGNIQYDFMKMKCIGAVMFVGHGNENGIYSRNSLVQGNQLVREFAMMPAERIYLVACNSRIIADQDTSKRAFGFPYAIDAELAALRLLLEFRQLTSW